MYRHTDEPCCLLVRSSDTKHWVLPKGHIESGEVPEAAAIREVLEEGGVRAEVVGALGVVAYGSSKEPVRVAFFLMRLLAEGLDREPRQIGWFTWDDAARLVSFDEAKTLIKRARMEVLRTDGGGL